MRDDVNGQPQPPWISIGVGNEIPRSAAVLRVRTDRWPTENLNDIINIEILNRSSQILRPRSQIHLIDQYFSHRRDFKRLSKNTA